MTVHLELSKLTTLGEKEFSAWLILFTQTITDLFEGEKATEAKERAGNIARLMNFKIQTQ